MVNKVSILIPAYNEQGSIEKLYNQIIDSLSLLEIGGG